MELLTRPKSTSSDPALVFEPWRQSRRSRLTWRVLIFMASCLVTFCFLHFCGNIGNTLSFSNSADFDAMIDGTAARPYVGRMLVPETLAEIDAHSPELLRNAAAAIFLSEGFIEDFNVGDFHRKHAFPYRTAVYCTLALLMFFGVGLGARAAYAAIYGEANAEFAAILFLIGIPFWFRYVAYIYDPCTILLATWMVYAIAKQKPFLCIALFALACFNKETSPLFIPIILIGLYPRLKWQRTIELGLFLALIAGLVQTFRVAHFSSNAGSWTEHHWADHQLALGHFAMSVLYAIVVMGAFLWLALQGFRTKPKLLQLGVFFILIPLFGASLIFGYLDEIRALFDAYPFVALLALPTLFAILQPPRPEPAWKVIGPQNA